MLTVQIQTVRDNASVPRRATQGAAGYDLTSPVNVIIPAGESALIPTGVIMAIPEGHYGRIASRSGLCVRYDIEAFSGTIDSDYRGEIHVKLRNYSKQPFEVTMGMRIAQLIFEKIALPEIQVENVLDETRRGAGGFGSTGLN